MEKKYPVLKCTKELWNEIKPVLESWGFNNFDNVMEDRFRIAPYLVSDLYGKFKVFANVVKLGFNPKRYLVNTKEEWLTDVAKLLGKEYPIKEMGAEMEKIVIGGIEIKPGMLLYLDDADVKEENFCIVFPYKNGLGIIPFHKKSYGWLRLENIVNKVTAIRDIYDKSTSIYINSGKILWRKPKKVTLTKQQIAEKFGIDIEQLDII